MNSSSKSSIISWGWAIGTLVLLFFISAAIFHVFSPSTFSYPNPREVGIRFISLFSDKEVFSAFASTAFRVVWIVVLAGIIGTCLGVLLGQDKRLWNASQPAVDFLRSLPVTFLIPPLALLLGSKSEMLLVTLVLVPCSLVLVINVRYAIGTLQEERALSFHLVTGKRDALSRFIHVTVPEITPFLLSGLRLSLSYAIVITTILEFMHIGPSENLGLGGLISDAMSAGDLPTVHVVAFVVGSTGMALNRLFETAERKFAQYTPSSSS